MKNKSITLISGSRDTGDSLSEQLQLYLNKEQTFSLIVLDEFCPESVESDLIIFSSRSLEEEAREKINRLKAGRFISGRRTISHKGIDSLVTIPAGTDILFINDDRESAEESIEALKKIGFNQFNYKPCYPPLLETEGIKTAITAGETHLVPPEVSKAYDLGSRVFDYPTLAAILSCLEISPDEIEAPSFRYLKKIVSTSAKVSAYSQKINKLNSQLIMLLEGSGEGILTYDTSGTVLMANENFRSSLTPGLESPVGYRLSEIFDSKELLSFLLKSRKEEGGRFYAGGKHFSVRKTLHENSSTYICSIVFSRGDMEETVHRERVAFDHLIGKSESFSRMKKQAEKLSLSNFNILIEGEKGTGRKLLARAISNSSHRKQQVCQTVRLEALDREQMESEIEALVSDRDEGTVILSEADLLPLDLQKKLLFFLIHTPEKKRIISTVSGDFYKKVESGAFLPELYYKLKESYLYIPPLRDREDDIPLILKAELKKTGVKLKVDRELISYLKSCCWSGNINELINTVRTMSALAETDVLTLACLPEGMIPDQRKYDRELPKASRSVLMAIEQLNKKGIVTGRAKLTILTDKMGERLTEAQIRRILKELTAEDFVRKEKGRYGLFISEKGRQALGTGDSSSKRQFSDFP
ncbi:sigma 54-interacting transcriptional regulator [Spirochaeta isovalerica]|uniref:Transcriptional regulator of acetoin/glycerol metabolism n=1 Tax=Spirochaeta isovalerica TaxID=150 RepID=A0A841RBP5_9SPIO|nr:sigma 54-interacting transcriptional regulator [Spirochaeta isovalerica]MBB6480098.1 transcriptional regulator of acetoin/glycerol metabolism [Spirochaeta isovalerica]